jgi:hypothetical protein
VPPDNRLFLGHVYRQEDDTLRDILARMRYAQLTSKDQAVLRQCRREVRYDDDVEPVALSVDSQVGHI